MQGKGRHLIYQARLASQIGIQTKPLSEGSAKFISKEKQHLCFKANRCMMEYNVKFM